MGMLIKNSEEQAFLEERARQEKVKKRRDYDKHVVSAVALR